MKKKKKQIRIYSCIKYQNLKESSLKKWNLYHIYTLEYNAQRQNIYNYTTKLSSIFQESLPMCCSVKPS